MNLAPLNVTLEKLALNVTMRVSGMKLSSPLPAIAREPKHHTTINDLFLPSLIQRRLKIWGTNQEVTENSKSMMTKPRSILS